LRWLQQENITEVEVTVLRENLVKVNNIPLIFRAPSLPELPANTRVQLAIGGIDLIDLDVQARFIAAITEEVACSPA
ncbi:MAG: RNB domain-containing ribonuclease, partial [Gallionella sp.]